MPPRSRSVSFCHFDREGLKARRVEKSCAVRIRRQAPLLRPRLLTTEKAGDEADECGAFTFTFLPLFRHRIPLKESQKRMIDLARHTIPRRNSPFTPPLYPLFSGIFQSACQLFSPFIKIFLKNFTKRPAKRLKNFSISTIL